jgi:hypothetical protein
MSRHQGWALAALVLVVLVGVAIWVRPTAVLEAPLLPMNFGHADHRSVECTTCHHNFIDDTGSGLCVDCHKTTPELAPLIETHFHHLCRDCHAQLALDVEPSGPLRSCEGCHQKDDMP